MAYPNFFNENINRTFPFRVGTAGIDTPDTGITTMLQLPDDFIADCGFILGPEAEFIEGRDSIFLRRIYRVNATTVTFEFGSNSPLLVALPLIFTRESSASTYQTEFVESAGLSLAFGCGAPAWSGYLVTGPISAVFARLAIGAQIVRIGAETLVEPALLQNLNGSQMTALNIANVDRTRALRPPGCPANSWAVSGDTFVIQRCLTGALQLRSGYNMSISQNAISNTLQFSAILGSGKGIPCAEVPLFAGESPPIGASAGLLGGDFYCNEVLRSVNGLQGPNLMLSAGAGVRVQPDAANHTVVIDIDLVTLSLCSPTSP